MLNAVWQVFAAAVLLAVIAILFWDFFVVERRSSRAKLLGVGAAILTVVAGVAMATDAGALPVLLLVVAGVCCSALARRADETSST